MAKTSRSNAKAAVSEDVEMQLEHYQEAEYGLYWSFDCLNNSFLYLPDNILWNSFICCLVLAAIVVAAIETESPFTEIFEVFYNVFYGIHVLGLAYRSLINLNNADLNVCTAVFFIVDILTFTPYFLRVQNIVFYKLLCNYVRLHRPLRYLRALSDHNLKGSILGTTLKFCYIFMILRITWVLIWVHFDALKSGNVLRTNEKNYNIQKQQIPKAVKLEIQPPWRFLSTFYIVNKMFIPIGPSVPPENDMERLTFLMIMITGCLTVTGAAVASLSLVISIYMRPEENFRTRFRLIMKEMQESNLPPSLREKVETFYKMYWHKQRAVSAATLIPIFPPSLRSIIYTDIYFKASQKCRILRDLSYQFLSELAKKTESIHYIPGDVIIQRNHKKSSMIYITYGDIEMLTAEDDSTAILRMIRGTVLSPCAGGAAACCARAHVQLRAATFCTAHVLHAPQLWRTVVKYGRETGQGAKILKAFHSHLEKVRGHYNIRHKEEAKYKSSILQFKRNLMNLKESKDAAGKLQLSQTDVMIEIAGCYIMRNRADASLTDETDAICLRPTFPCILQPRSSLQVVWHTFITCLIITVCITHPYFLVYKKKVPIEFRFYDYVVTVIYALDLIVHLSTGANVEDGVPINLAQTSSQQAKSKWFVLDVIGTLPILEFIGDGHFAGLNKLLRLPKVFRMLKTVEDECVYHSNVVRFCSYSLLFLFSCYLLAALQQGFMCFQFGYCIVSNFTHSPYWEKRSLDTDTVEKRLTFGLYWAISMLTFTAHMETWGMEEWRHVSYTIFVLEICVILYIFIEAFYSATIMVTSALREEHDACIENVTKFLTRKAVDPVLKQRFIEYLQLCWYTDRAYSMTNKKSSIFYDLPEHVYQDIVSRQRSKYILSIPFMKWLHKEDLKTISSKARLFCISPNEVILNTGDMSNEMFVIKQGICEAQKLLDRFQNFFYHYLEGFFRIRIGYILSRKIDRIFRGSENCGILSPVTKGVVGEVSARSHFGVLECLLRIPAFYTVRAVTHVELFTISRKHLINAIEVPKIKDAIEFSKDQPVTFYLLSYMFINIIQYARLQIRHEPFTSYRPPDPPPNMERFRLPRKYEQDHAFLNPFYKLGLLSVLRYIFPRFTLRPDGRYLVRYEWIRAGAALMSALLFPAYTYLVLQWPGLYFIAWLLDLSAYFDILQRMLVGYYNNIGILVYHPSSTAAHYVKGAFIVDLLGCLPLEWLESSWKESFQNRYREAPTKQFLMLNRLLQLYRTPAAQLGLAPFIRRDILLVIKALPLFLALLNVLTCFVVYFSVNIFYSPNTMEWLIVPIADNGGSWIQIFKSAYRFNVTETPWNLYLGSYFWVVYETTTTGYSSFKPTNFNLMRVLIAGMIIGALIITYFSVRIISMRANVNKNLAAFQEHMKDISLFMKRENLDSNLQKQVLEHYNYNWERMGGIDYRNVLKLCEQITLRTDAILQIYGPTFTKCPILNKCDVSLLRLIGRAVRSCYFLKNTTIIEEDDVIADIFFVQHGYVELIDPKDEAVVTLRKGSMFGNLSSPAPLRCPDRFLSGSAVHVLHINTHVFFSIITDFPEVQTLLKEHRPNNEGYIIGLQSPGAISRKNSASSSSALRTHGGIGNIQQSTARIYLTVVSLLCIYADIYNAGFQDNRLFLILALYLLDFCFMWKFLIQYFMPQHNDIDDDDHKSLSKVRWQYFKYEFKYDLISLVPFEALCLFSNSNRGMLFSWLRLNRLFRIVTIYKCLKRHQESISGNLTLSTAGTVLVWFTLFVHTSTSLWFFIGTLEEKKTEKSSWTYNDAGGSWCQNNYVCSLYFILTTFTQTGVGDILPKKQSEVIFVSGFQIISTMMFMVYVGELSNIIQYRSFRSFNFYSSYLELQEFLKNNRVSKNLVSIINKYSLHLWRESRGLQMPYFLTTAPNCLKLQVMGAAYLKHLTANEIFKNCEPAFLRQLVGFLQLYTFNEEMFVVKENEITDSMYIIHTGRVVEVSENSNVVRPYHPGDYFGEGLGNDIHFTKSYKTTMKTQILMLYLNDWKYLLDHFPVSKSFIYKHMRFGNQSDDNGDGHNGKKSKDINKEVLSIPRAHKNDTRSTNVEAFNDRPSMQIDNIEPYGSKFQPETDAQSLQNYGLYDIDRGSKIRLKFNWDPPESFEDKTIPSKDEEDLKFEESKENKNKESVSTNRNRKKSKKITTKKNKYIDEFKSVEDYISEKHGISSPELNKKYNKTYAGSVEVASTSGLKRRKPHVRYQEGETTPHPTDVHEFKPIRDLSIDKRNLQSLDSDMPLNIKESDSSTDSEDRFNTGPKNKDDK